MFLFLQQRSSSSSSPELSSLIEARYQFGRLPLLIKKLHCYFQAKKRRSMPVDVLVSELSRDNNGSNSVEIRRDLKKLSEIISEWCEIKMMTIEQTENFAIKAAAMNMNVKVLAAKIEQMQQETEQKIAMLNANVK